MAETQSPGVKMADDYLTANSPQAGEDGPPARRRWNCPSEERLAAYLDGAMGSDGRGRIESHLVDCEFCRSLVADVAKLQRLEAQALPAGLLRNAIAFGSTKPRRLRWVFLPVATTAGVGIAVIVALFLRSPEQLVVSSPSAPSAPVIAKAEPAPTFEPPVAHIERNLTSREVLPQIVSPKQGKVVPRDQLKFQWKPLLGARYYEIHVVTPEGDLVWEGQSEAAILKFPSDVTLKDGPYFVWISANLADGRVPKSIPVRFLVSTSP